MRREPLRVVYMGTPEFAVPALRAIAAGTDELVGVFTNPDRPSGRGTRVTESPVKRAAVELGVPAVVQPQSFRKDPAAISALSALEPDAVVVAAYGQILPQAALDIPRLGSWNIHASLLPKLRGAAPINWAIARGHKMSGVTIMRMEAGLDTGPILSKSAVAIPEQWRANDLHDALAILGAEMIVAALERIARGAPELEAQDEAAASWAPMLSKEDGRLDFTRPAAEIAQRIKGFYPWPGAFALAPGPGSAPVRLKIHDAQPSPGAGATPGEVVRASAAGDELVVACGEGAVRLLSIQAPGRRPMGPRDFLNGFSLCQGQRLLGRDPGSGEASS